MSLFDILNTGRTAVYYLLALLVPALHLAFAIAVFSDARRARAHGVRMALVPGAIWAAATLVFGLLGAAFYWLAHHSALRRVGEA